MSDRSEYLGFIQATVSRMASHSFAMKGWSITLVFAVAALGCRSKTPSS